MYLFVCVRVSRRQYSFYVIWYYTKLNRYTGSDDIGKFRGDICSAPHIAVVDTQAVDQTANVSVICRKPLFLPKLCVPKFSCKLECNSFSLFFH